MSDLISRLGAGQIIMSFVSPAWLSVKMSKFWMKASIQSRPFKKVFQKSTGGNRKDNCGGKMKV